MTSLMEIDAQAKPLTIFEQWMREAKSNPGIREPTAMALATADPATGVHVRIVLCKSWSTDGFVFYTNYESQKGRDLVASPEAGAVFYWDPMARQVRISGQIEKTSRAESEAYWASRARESQLSQWISQQSRAVASREVLHKLRAEAESKFAGQNIPCPQHWGGYVLRPKAIEFWIGQPNRLHDRHQFEKANQAWTYRRLYP
jgi:pyridoxamine 5'-phosphate oxidase